MTPSRGSSSRRRSTVSAAEFDVEPAAALDAPAPEVPEGTTLAGRARELERDLRLMGPINPLALEEHRALQERAEFLQAQLDDVRNSRRELNRVIRAVDKRDRRRCSSRRSTTSRSTSRASSPRCSRAGTGKLSLLDPDDLLETGIEIEARPSGKNVRRLSLLSGGERSLTALAYLFAVFRARPSPFYLLDEVEAALDDVNLHRFLDLVHEFRDEAQLVIVTHQKRTMEAGDILYGVSMPPGWLDEGRQPARRRRRRRNRLVLARGLALAADAQSAACGPRGDRAWLCTTIYRITGSQDAAEVADALAKPLRIVLILVLAWIVARVLRRVVTRAAQRLRDQPARVRSSTARRIRGCSTTSPDVGMRSGSTRSPPCLRSVVGVLVWAIAVLIVLADLGVDLAPLLGERRRRHRRHRVRRAAGRARLPRGALHAARGPVRRRRRDRHGRGDRAPSSR